MSRAFNQKRKQDLYLNRKQTQHNFKKPLQKLVLTLAF